MPHPWFGLAAVVAAGIACSDNSPGTTGPLPECTGAVTVAVSSGTTPTFTWAPSYRLFFVLVEPAQSGADLWSVGSDGTNAIRPPVIYGTVPNGARELQSVTPLVTGATYDVYVYRWTGPGTQDGVLAGSKAFTQ